MEILDLYAGIGWKDRKEILEKRGHKVTTLDFDPAFGCDITKDIMEVTDLGLYDFVWAFGNKSYLSLAKGITITPRNK